LASVIRAFIAIKLSPEIHQGLKDLNLLLKQRLPDAPVRWVQVNNIHLTLKFLGDVSTANLETLTKLLQSEALNYPTFEISVGELGAFPSAHRPRVVWVGVQAPAELNNLQQGIEQKMARLGYKSEDRPFSPHLTLGRVSRNAGTQDFVRMEAALTTTKVSYIGAMLVNAVHLFKSDLQSSGPIYTELLEAPLKNDR
jgi:2'-5' RNA ligase